jgi:hypothetical protein
VENRALVLAGGSVEGLLHQLAAWDAPVVDKWISA